MWSRGLGANQLIQSHSRSVCRPSRMPKANGPVTRSSLANLADELIHRVARKHRNLCLELRSIHWHPDTLDSCLEHQGESLHRVCTGCHVDLPFRQAVFRSKSAASGSITHPQEPLDSPRDPSRFRMSWVVYRAYCKHVASTSRRCSV